MALQILPIIKAVAPYLTHIAAAAIPAFTSKPAETAKVDPIIAKQIEELQSAATRNSESIHVLAEKLQQSMLGLESAAEDARKQIAIYKTMLYLSLVLSFTSFMICIYLLAT